MNADDGDNEIALTKAVRATLRAELRRTGVTAIMLLGTASDLPEGLDARAVNRWIGGSVRAAPKAQFEYVLGQWAALPDCDGQKRGKGYPIASGLWIEVTEAMSAELRYELGRTGVGHATLLDDVPGVPSGLNARIIGGWLYHQAATTKATHWAFVIGHLRSLPNMTTPLPPLRRARRNP